MKDKIKKINSEFTILEKEKDYKFIFNKKSEKIYIYNEELVEKTIDSSFNQKYRKLLYIVMDIVENEDSTESDAELILFKIDELKNLLLTKYYKFISKELLNKYLKMLLLLEEKLETRHKHRGR